MKKFTLLLAAFISSTLAYSGSIVIDFTTNSLGLPTDYTKTAETYTTTEGYKVAFGESNSGFKYNNYTGSEAVIFGKSGASVTFSNLNKPIEKVIITGRSGGSASVKWDFKEDSKTLYSGTGCKQTYTINVSGNSVANYTIAITSKHNMQIAKIEFVYPDDQNAPSIDCEKIEFGNVFTFLPVISKEVNVIGKNLTEAIVPTLSENSNFSFEGTLTTDGGTLTITLNATEEGTYTDVLTLTSGETTFTVNISATLVKVSGEGTKDKPFTLEDVAIINGAIGTTNSYWVIGYICGSLANGTADVLAEEAQASNLALGSTAEATEWTPVALPNNSEVRTALNVKDNPSNIGKQVKVYGTLETYFSKAGVKNVTDYELQKAPTAISNATVAEKAVKMIENGQLVIIREGVKYNAQGVRLQ